MRRPRITARAERKSLPIYRDLPVTLQVGDGTVAYLTIQEALDLARMLLDAAGALLNDEIRRPPAQCGVCSAFIRPGVTGRCANCGAEWDNGPTSGH